LTAVAVKEKNEGAAADFPANLTTYGRQSSQHLFDFKAGGDSAEAQHVVNPVKSE